MNTKTTTYTNITTNTSYQNNMDNKKNIIPETWTTITKDKKTGKIIINTPKVSKKEQQIKEHKEAIKNRKEDLKRSEKCINKMINNWNTFRDYENEVMGDRSFYYNYKEELEKMLNEEQYILEEINNINNGYISDDSEFSDDENRYRYINH